MNKSDFHHTRNSLKCCRISQTGVMQPAHSCLQCNVLRIHPNFERPLQKGLTIISDGLHCDFRCQSDQSLSGCIVIFPCLLWWSLGWLLCLCITWGDLVHTIKLSHHVCTWFLAGPLPWMGHLVVRQEQARSPH